MCELSYPHKSENTLLYCIRKNKYIKKINIIDFIFRKKQKFVFYKIYT